MKSIHRRIIWQYIILSAIGNGAGTAIICGTYVSFLRSHGLSNFETNLVNAVYFSSLFIFEIPTGAFADVYGRKKSFIVSKFVLSAGMFIYAASSSILGFVIAEIVGAFGRTFMTGAFQSWMVDSLKHHGYKEDTAKVMASESIARQIASGIGAVAGSLSSAYALSTPWLIAGFGLMCTGVIAWITMEEEYFVPIKTHWRSGLMKMKDTIVTSFRYSKSDKNVRFVLVTNFILIMSVQALNMYWQPVFEKLGTSTNLLGVIFAGIMVFTAIGSLIMRQINTKKNPERTMTITLIMTGAVVILTALCGSFWPAISLFLLHECGRGMIQPLLSGYMHDSIPSSERATISSFCEMSPHIGGVIGLVGSGFVAQTLGIECSWIMSGALLTIGMIMLSQKR